MSSLVDDSVEERIRRMYLEIFAHHDSYYNFVRITFCQNLSIKIISHSRFKLAVTFTILIGNHHYEILDRAYSDRRWSNRFRHVSPTGLNFLF